MAAGVAFRAQLRDAGVAADIIDAMKLPTTDDLAAAEQADDDAPTSSGWLR